MVSSGVGSSGVGSSCGGGSNHHCNYYLCPK